MQFTEHEMTVGLTTVAQAIVLGPQGVDLSSPSAVEAAWNSLTPIERFRVLDSVGDVLFPVLSNLPDLDVTPGQSFDFTPAQIQDAVLEAHEARTATGKAPDLTGDDLNSHLARVALVASAAITAMPVRVDVDGLLRGPEFDVGVPDTPEGLT